MLADFFFNLPPLLRGLIEGLAVILVIFPIAGVCSMAERKVAAWIQDRPGPNRAIVPWIGWIPVIGRFLQRLGLFHVMADGGKMLFKEDPTPGHVNKFYFIAGADPRDDSGADHGHGGPVRGLSRGGRARGAAWARARSTLESWRCSRSPRWASIR